MAAHEHADPQLDYTPFLGGNHELFKAFRILVSGDTVPHFLKSDGLNRRRTTSRGHVDDSDLKQYKLEDDIESEQ
jgi:hypothetical protein